MITGWTTYHLIGVKYNDDFIPIEKAIRDCLKDSPKFITKRDLDGKSEDEINAMTEQSKKDWEAYNANPCKDGMQEKYEQLKSLYSRMEQEVIDYCVKYHIFISDMEHQNTDWGVPIFDNKYLWQESLRGWSGTMAEVWNKIYNTDQYGYLDFYCQDDGGIVKDYKKPYEV